MHPSSYEHMRDLVARYLAPDVRRVVDLGSYDVNGTYRSLFAGSQVQYIGLDLESGPGVDIALESPYRFPLNTDSVDLVVSGQAFEHVEFFWLSFAEMVRVIRPGGMIFLIAPSRGPEHRYPQDCWRFYPDGYRALAKYAGCELVEVQTDWTTTGHYGSEEWGDTVGVFRKTQVGLRQRFANMLNRVAWALIESRSR